MTTLTTIATAIASLTQLNLAIDQARAAGFNVEAYISIGGNSGISAGEAAAAVASAPVSVAPVTASAAPAGSVPRPVSTVAEEVKPTDEVKQADSEFNVDARIESLLGTELYVKRTTKSSSGYVRVADSAADRDETLYIGQPSDVIPVGFVNVYKGSLGTTVHKSLDLAGKYGSGKEIATMPVYKTREEALRLKGEEDVPPFDVQARINSLIGTTIGIVRTSNSSSGYRVASDGETTDNNVTIRHENAEGGVIGYVNVYKSSLGTTVHRTKAKAEQYANGNEIGLVSVGY